MIPPPIQAIPQHPNSTNYQGYKRKVNTYTIVHPPQQFPGANATLPNFITTQNVQNVANKENVVFNTHPLIATTGETIKAVGDCIKATQIVINESQTIEALLREKIPDLHKPKHPTSPVVLQMKVKSEIVKPTPKCIRKVDQELSIRSSSPGYAESFRKVNNLIDDIKSKISYAKNLKTVNLLPQNSQSAIPAAPSDLIENSSKGDCHIQNYISEMEVSKKSESSQQLISEISYTLRSSSSFEKPVGNFSREICLVDYKDGSYYQGHLTDGIRNGFGCFYDKTKRLIYEGEWVNDKYSGEGTLLNYPSGEEPVVRKFDADEDSKTNFSGLLPFWQIYTGKFKNGQKHGKGILHFSTGQRFIGEFFEGRILGIGEFYASETEIVKGDWINGKLLS